MIFEDSLLDDCSSREFYVIAWAVRLFNEKKRWPTVEQIAVSSKLPYGSVAEAVASSASLEFLVPFEGDLQTPVMVVSDRVYTKKA